MRVCTKSGCGVIVKAGRCKKHAREAEPNAPHYKKRESASKRGYNYAWRKARLSFIKKHPLCVHHHQRGFTVVATDVDHIIPHGGDTKLFWDKTNWQSLCHSCHSVKTRHEQMR